MSRLFLLEGLEGLKAATAIRRSRARWARLLALSSLVSLLAIASTDAFAQGAIAFQQWDSTLTDEIIDSVGDSASKTGHAAVKSSMGNNPALNGSAWAHQAAFWSLYIDGVSTIRITVLSDSAVLAPGVSVWAIGNTAMFDGGTTNWGGEISNAAFGTPHSFNAYEALGSSGTLWMQDGQGGNAKELLGYAMSGPTYAGVPTGWGESIVSGVHDKRTGSTYAGEVTGLTGAGLAQLTLTDVATGWYLIYVGGTDHTLSGGDFDLMVVGEAENLPGLSPFAIVGLTVVIAGVGAVRLRRHRPRL